MTNAKRRTPPKTARTPAAPVAERLESALAWLRAHATKKTLEGMTRYGLPSDGALGVSLADIQRLAKSLGRDHDLAAALWKSGVYEARLLAAFVDDPARVTAAQMDRWTRDFDNWGVCDTLCFHLYDRAPHAWAKVGEWSGARDEFVKRAAFALLACLAGHDKAAADARFLGGLALVEAAAGDDRNFVKKAVNWALRRIGSRNAALYDAATAVATRLAASPDAAPRWIGKDALREFRGAVALRRLAKQRRAAGAAS